jgi:hypothetical protein
MVGRLASETHRDDFDEDRRPIFADAACPYPKKFRLQDEIDGRLRMPPSAFDPKRSVADDRFRRIIWTGLAARVQTRR